MKKLNVRRRVCPFLSYSERLAGVLVLGISAAFLLFNPVDARAGLIDKAMGSLAAGDPAEARRLARAVLADEPANARALLLLAQTEPGGRTAQSWAEQAIAAAAGRSPGDEATLFLIEALAASKSYGAIAERAERFYRDFGRDNKYADAVRWWGALANLRLGRSSVADADLNWAIKNPTSSEWSRSLRLLYADSRTDVEQAVGAYRDLMRVNDSYIESQCLLGLIRAYKRLGESDRVILYRGILAEKYPNVSLQFIDPAASSAPAPAATDNEAELLADIEYTVQLGAFSNADNAKQLRVKYQKRGYTVHSFSRTVAGKKYWVVQVGSFALLEQARELQEKLQREDKANYRVVVR